MIGDVNFEHLAKVLPLLYFHTMKLLFFPSIINKCVL